MSDSRAIALALCAGCVATSPAAGQPCGRSVEVFAESSRSFTLTTTDDWEIVDGVCLTVAAATALYNGVSSFCNGSASCEEVPTLIYPPDFVLGGNSKSPDEGGSPPCSSSAGAGLSGIGEAQGTRFVYGVTASAIATITSNRVTASTQSSIEINTFIEGLGTCLDSAFVGGGAATSFPFVGGVRFQPKAGVTDPSSPIYNFSTTSVQTRRIVIRFGPALVVEDAGDGELLAQGVVEPGESPVVLRSVSLLLGDSGGLDSTILAEDVITQTSDGSAFHATPGYVQDSTDPTLYVSTRSGSGSEELLTLRFVDASYQLDGFDVDEDGRFTVRDAESLREIIDLGIGGATGESILALFDANGNGQIDSATSQEFEVSEAQTAADTLDQMEAIIASRLDAGVFGDFNRNGVFDCIDLQAVNSQFPFSSIGDGLGDPFTVSGYFPELDADLDGDVDESDRAALLALVPENPADVTTRGATIPGSSGFGIPDGVVDLDDLGFFLNAWLDSDASIADLTSGATLPGQPGFGIPDGAADLDDLGLFLNFWRGDLACP